MAQPQSEGSENMAADPAKIDGPEGSKTIATILPNEPSCAEGSKGHSRPTLGRHIFSKKK